MKILKITLFVGVLFLIFFLRYYMLDGIPSGINADEASLGYDTYSLLVTGKDQYGKDFPVFLRSFGAYQSPLYTYLSTVFIALFGLSIFSVRFLSALVGSLTILITFIIIYSNLKEKNRFWLSLLASFIFSFTPWSIFFSRTAVEANLGLFLVVTAIYFLLKSLQGAKFFIVGSAFLAISTYAYQAQRLGSLLLLLGFILIFVSRFINKKRVVLIGVLLFITLQIPQIMLIDSQAGTRRLLQVNYFSKEYFDQNGGELKSVLFGREIYIYNQFLSHYFSYFSPKNLFFEPDPQQIRSIPNLSVFYNWMFIPFFIGLKIFWDKRKDPLIKTSLLLMVLSVIPAALTREPFYTLRVLPLFWVLTVIIAFGSYEIISKLRFNSIRIIFLSIISLVSLSILITHFFVFLKYEKSWDYGLPYIELAKKSEELPSKKFVLDLNRQNQAYIWFALIKKYDPRLLQKQGTSVLEKYYNASDFNGERTIGNVEFRTIDWGIDQCQDEILIRDEMSISEEQVRDHKLSLEFEIPDISGVIRLRGYSTNPKEKCI